ncbi:MAG TPA: hypothetical protein VLV78_12870 [Thermoanaerobaculia bacterium]|nr:hypothetical protein [Thermoanaerobaculia bacterium]
MFRLNKRSAVFAALVALALFAAPGYAQCPLAAPTPVSPANGATGVQSSVTFTWTAVQGATSYEVWASADGVNFVQLGTSSTTTLISDIYSGINVEWYVVSVNSSCKSLESFHFRFSTGGCTGPATDLIFPEDGNTFVSSPVRFFWSSVPSADFYRLWINQWDADAKEWLGWEYWDETYRTESRIYLEPRYYAWEIETVFADCDSNYSEPNIFLVPQAANCPTEKPKILTPASGSSTKSPVTLSWSALPGAINYEVWASLDNGDLQFVDETPSNSMVVYVGYGHVEWLVVAQFNGCNDAISDTATFDVAYDPACDHYAPYPIVPAYGVNNAPTRLDFVWTPVDGASRYNVWASVNEGDAFIVGSTTNTRLSADVQAGVIAWAVEAEFNGCSPTLSPVSVFVAENATACTPPAAPDIYISPAATSGDQFFILWSPGTNTSGFELQESTDPSFAGANTRAVNDVLIGLSHQVTTPTRYYYRVRSKSNCNAGDGPYSDAASIVVQPLVAQTGDRAGTIAAYGTQAGVIQKIHIPGSASGPSAESRGLAQGFTATADEPWITITPSSGTIPPEGIDLTITSDPRKLAVGTSTATVRITTTASAGTPTSVPVSISLVTPVSPDAGTSPQPNSLIIPAVGHAAGAGTTFESDVRITNTSAQAMKYLLNFTPTRSDGTKSGQQATIQIDAGETTALNDILKNFFGFAGANDSVLGVLEIRPISSVSSSNGSQGNVTFASSRTFAVAPQGTYGQYIPAIPFSSFIGRDSRITLSQIANAGGYRTNLGLVEAAGESATVHFTVRNAAGAVVSEFDKNLMPGEHQQFALDSPVDNGRIEATVTSLSGKVTAYASVVDNKTNDPMLILPVNTANISASRYVLPGMAQTSGATNWRSDVRLLNAGSSPAQATISFYTIGSTTPETVTRTIEAGQMLVFDEALRSLFGKSNDAGAIVVGTTSDSKIVASARTYNQTATGTYGQFIPGLTAGDGVGKDDRALQVLQVESSDRFRTNLGLVELTGKEVNLEIAAYTPDSKVSVYIPWHLGPNEFVQINDILGRMGIPKAYNARISMRVTGGDGKISGYASLIDNRTQDPTYVPAQ